MKNSSIKLFCRVLAIAATLALLAGCAVAPRTEAPDGPAVVLQAFEELGGEASDPTVWCKVGFRYIYSPDLPVHARQMSYEVVGSSMLSGGGALPLPRPERDPRPTQREDGMMVMQVNISAFDPCRRQNSDEGPTVRFSIGECADGDCPPMRFEVANDPSLVRLELVAE